MTTPAATPLSPKIINDAMWTTGEITLISGDGVLFKVGRDVLSIGSSVLRDMMGSDDKSAFIPFTDEVIESAKNIRMFLNLVHCNLPSVAFFEQEGKILEVLSFLIKYDCVQPIKFLSVTLRLAVHTNRIWTRPVFVFAAMTDDVNLCRDMVRIAGPKILSTSKFDRVPVYIPYEVFKCLPTKYSYALMTAYAERVRVSTSNFEAVFFEALNKPSDG